MSENITPSQALLRLLTTKKGLNDMTDLINKRLPGIPDRTLAFIVLSAGGTVEKFFSDDGKAYVRLTIGSRVLEADTNTRLLIQVMELLKNDQ